MVDAVFDGWVERYEESVCTCLHFDDVTMKGGECFSWDFTWVFGKSAL